MIVAPNPQLDRARCVALGGSLWSQQPAYAAAEQRRVRSRRYDYRRGLALELLRDLEREHRRPPDRSERVIHAASALVDTFLGTGVGFAGLTPPRIIQSRTCQLWVRADLGATMHQTLAQLNPAPTLIIRGSLTQRFAMRVTVAAVGTGALGSTTLNIWLNWFTGSVAAPDIAGFVTTATMTQLLDTDIWLSCGAGPYDAADEWVSRITSLADGSGAGGNRDFVNNNLQTSPRYTSSASAINGRPFFSGVAADAIRFHSAYAPPDPGTDPSLVIWTQVADAFVNTGSFWGTGNVGAPFRVRQANPTPTYAQSGTVAENSNVNMVIGTWLGCEAYFADSAADRLRTGSTPTAAAPAGGCASGTPVGVTLFARNSAADLPSTCSIAELALFTGGDATNAELLLDRARRTVVFGVAA